MGRSHKGQSDTELSEIRRLKLENQKLKKQMGKLRKQLARIDIDRYSNLRDMLEAQAAEDGGFDAQVELEELKQKWLCHECKEDYLRVIIVPRADGLFYMRKCASCSHRTKLKKYTDEVDGLDSSGQPIEV
jgi:ATP-dependent exoDNAse (exonuclease V) beta subunit